LTISWNLAVDEVSGVACYMVGIGKDAASAAMTATQASTPFSAELPDGNCSVFVWAVDLAGNSNPDPLVFGPFLIDTTAPGAVESQVTGVEGRPGWYRSNVSLDLSCNDTTSGIAFFEVSLGEGPWTTQTTPLLLNGEGVHSFRVRAVDNAGNVGPVQAMTVSIDASAPLLALAAKVDGGVRVNASAADPLSGLVSQALSIDGSSPQFPIGSEYDGVISLQPGKHVLTLTAEDAAGNQAVLSVEVTVPSPGVASEVLIAIALAVALAVVVGLIIFRKRRKG
jgi:hypothetical protein